VRRRIIRPWAIATTTVARASPAARRWWPAALAPPGWPRFTVVATAARRAAALPPPARTTTGQRPRPAGACPWCSYRTAVVRGRSWTSASTRMRWRVGRLSGDAGRPSLAPPPKALLVISAHWEEPVPTVMTAARPPMPVRLTTASRPASYQITWPAPRRSTLAAARTAACWAPPASTAPRIRPRGFDHGTFVPLKLLTPRQPFPRSSCRCAAASTRASTWRWQRAGASSRRGGLHHRSGMTFSTTCAPRRPARARRLRGVRLLLRASAALPRGRAQPAPGRLGASAVGALRPPARGHLLPLMVVAGAAGRDRASSPSGAYAPGRSTLDGPVSATRMALLEHA